MKPGKQMRYFKNSTPFIGIGAIAVIGGFLLYWYSWELWMLGTPIMLGGVVMLIIGFGFRESDLSYSTYFDSKIDSLTSGRHTDSKPDYTAAEYSFDGNKFSKIDSSQTPRSELFIRTDIYFGKNTLTVELFRVDASADTITNEKFEFPLTEVKASIDNVEIRCNGLLKKVALMTVGIQNGNSCTFPVRYNDIDVDRLADRINQAKAKV